MLTVYFTCFEKFAHNSINSLADNTDNRSFCGYHLK